MRIIIKVVAIIILTSLSSYCATTTLKGSAKSTSVKESSTTANDNTEMEQTLS